MRVTPPRLSNIRSLSNVVMILAKGRATGRATGFRPNCLSLTSSLRHYLPAVLGVMPVI